MKDRTIILNLLNKFSSDHTNISWKMECSYSDGKGTTINEIKLLAQPGNKAIGVFSYWVETGKVMFCSYKNFKKTNSQNIIDLLLDVINYSKGEILE
jgi:hypothetical protein